jgi:uncharacterized iron-regulated protein
MKVDFSKFLLEKIHGKKIILIGEIHGTKEIPKLLTNFFSEYIIKNDFNICLEISSSEQTKIDIFMKSGDVSIIKDIFYNNEENDGRRSLEYLELIRYMYYLNKKHHKKTKINCVDVDVDFHPKDFQNEREKIMANNILNSLTKKTFVILGNIHASKEKVETTGFTIIPTGFYIFQKLKDKVININITPIKGSFYNLSIKKIETNLSSNEFNTKFDFNYYIGCVSPATIVHTK